MFGLRGPSTGPGTAKKRLRMKNRSRGKGRDLQGPRIEKITTSDVWVCALQRSSAPKKLVRPDFGHFRPSEALNGPRERQKTTQDEKPVPGKGSRHPGADVAIFLRRLDLKAQASARSNFFDARSQGVPGGPGTFPGTGLPSWADF